MFTQNNAIRTYRDKLSPVLVKRYGGSGQYTQAQITKTAAELRLNQKYIRYAFLMYCHPENLDSDFFKDDDIHTMQTTIATALGGGLSMSTVFQSAGDVGGGMGIGDGGGGE